MKKVAFLFIMLTLTNCQGQEKKTKTINLKKNTIMIEKFDFERYNEAEQSPVEYTKQDGTYVIMAFSKHSGGNYYEYPPSPSFCKIYKEFYPNGYLKKKETYIGENVKIGISRYYDEQGNLIKEADEDQKFGKIKPQQVLEFLQEKGYINLKTGEGRVGEDGQPVFELDFYEENAKKIWSITIRKGKPNNDPSNFPDIGEPSAYIPIVYKMDGETGEVTIEGEEDKKTSGVYKTYKGKSYTQQEWEEFEQKLFEEYAGKHNLRSAIDIEKERNKKGGGFFLGEREVTD